LYPFLSQQSDHNNPQYHPDIDALDAPQVEKQDGYDLALCQKISTFQEHYFAIYPKLTYVNPGWCLPSFFFHWMFLNFSAPSPKITLDCYIFLFSRIFGCHCIVLLFFMIIAVSAQLLCWLLQYQRSSCAVCNPGKWGDVKSKICLLFIINDQNF